MPIYGGEAAGTEASPKQVVQGPGKADIDSVSCLRVLSPELNDDRYHEYRV